MLAAVSVHAMAVSSVSRGEGCAVHLVHGAELGCIETVRVQRSILACVLGSCSVILMFPLVVTQSSDYCVHHFRVV